MLDKLQNPLSLAGRVLRRCVERGRSPPAMSPGSIVVRKSSGRPAQALPQA